ncbi:14674_t:CDS:2, partial [Racocetra fulgida]
MKNSSKEYESLSFRDTDAPTEKTDEDNSPEGANGILPDKSDDTDNDSDFDDESFREMSKSWELAKELLNIPVETRTPDRLPLSPQLAPISNLEAGLKEIIDTADKTIDDFKKETEAEVEMAQEEKLLAKKAATETKLTNLRDKLDQLEKKLAEVINGTDDGTKKKEGQIECANKEHKKDLLKKLNEAVKDKTR